jgi:mRNA interferase HigB
VHVISKRGLLLLADSQRLDAATRRELSQWYRMARAARWNSLADVRVHFPAADRVGSVLIFNISHNKYRLLVRHAFPEQRLFVKALLNHKQYDRKEWLKWS